MATSDLIKRWRALVQEVIRAPDSADLWATLIDDAMQTSPAFEVAIRKTEGPREYDAKLDFARGVIRRDYQNDVDGIVKDLIQQIKDGDIADGEAMIEAIDAAVDGTQRVIYTQQAKEGLVLGTENAEAYSDEFGADGIVEGGAIQWERLMYAAMRADVIADLEREGIDVNDPQPPEDEEESG